MARNILKCLALFLLFNFPKYAHSACQHIGGIVHAYNTSEISGTLSTGTIVYSMEDNSLKIWNGTTWSTIQQGGGSGGLGYTISVQALTSSPADGATTYFGQLPKAPTTTANTSKIYIPKTGTIKVARIYCYSGTAGTNQNWSLYIRLNNTTDTLIQTISSATNERVFTNTGLNIAVVAGDYIEIKSVQPTWATNPATTIYGGYLYIE